VFRDKRYARGLAERFGFLPASLHSTAPETVWLHAVSVGEILSAAELMRRLRAARPHVRIFVSTTTLAGRATAAQRLGRLAEAVFYAPLDYRSAVRRVLRRLRPAAVVVLETEIWPNLYREAKHAGAALVVVNGRISDRAWPRYRAWRFLFRHVLAQPDAILAQSAQDQSRYLAAGAPPERVACSGNLKYDFTPPGPVPQDIDAFLDRTWPEAVWIAASTMPPAEPADPDEDDAVLAAFHTVAARHSRLLLILAPRRPERFEQAAEKLRRAGVSFVRRTRLDADVTLPGVLLLDSIGELAALFHRATVVFLGGTLVNRGGHNLLEPAFFGKPVIAGPHMENFAAMETEFAAAGALVKITGATRLAEAVDELIRDPGRASAIGETARVLAESKRGVAESAAREVLRHAAFALPHPAQPLPQRLLLTPLSWLWAAGHRVHMSARLLSQRALSTRVVSVGGLAMGGSGKTPLVAHLAGKAREAGLEPAILTRGYRRKSIQPVVALARGEAASVDLTGDEAQIFLRQGAAHVGIGADRLAAGQQLERSLHPGVFLLDDAFQYLKLKRDREVVLIDALDPLGGGLFPLGRRREPLSGLSRATVVVVTRTTPGQDIAGIERLVRRYNREAPVFRSRVVPREWLDVEWGTSRPVDATDARRVAAFCGLGNPESFYQSLRSLNLEIVFSWSFADHHRYRPAELIRLSRRAADAGAEALVTTEKDVMNFCAGAPALVAPLRLYWLRIAVEIDNEEEFLRCVL
jgi:tetraacyldisaccharide 4'-kinase